MTFFTEQMKALTEEILNAGQERGEFLAAVHETTGTLLSDARAFVRHLDEEHRAMATAFHKELADDRRGRSDEVRQMRQEHRDEHRARREGLQQMFTQTLNHLHDQVNGLRETCQQAQRRTAADLGGAGQAWREMSKARNGRSPAQPRAKHRREHPPAK